MAGKGRRFVFHGAYTSRRKALGKKHAVGGFVKRVRVKRKGSKVAHVRWVVLTRKEA